MVSYNKGRVRYIRHPWNGIRLFEIWVEGKGLFRRRDRGSSDWTNEQGTILMKEDIPNMLFPYPVMTRRKLNLMGQVKGINRLLERIRTGGYLD